MEFVLAVLPSRTQVMAFYQFLRRVGVVCAIVDTPREISKSCGVCVKFSIKNYIMVKSLCNQNYTSVRFYKYTKNGLGKITLFAIK